MFEWLTKQGKNPMFKVSIDTIRRHQAANRVGLKHRLIVAEQVALFVALPMFAIGCYVGYTAHAAAEAQIAQAVQAATATPAPSPK